MQPYFFPYMGYFQLIQAVDVFVIYDNIKYTKKGWINRNRMLQGGRDVIFSLPLRSGADSLDVHERKLAANFNRNKLLNQLRGNYRRAPQFAEVFPMIEQAIRCEDQNLFSYLLNALKTTCRHLLLSTPIQVSSSIDIDHALKGQDKVIAIAKAVGATTYVNAIGGLGLYEPTAFLAQGLKLNFVRSMPLEYRQFGDDFVPGLSIIDMLMFNPTGDVQKVARIGYELL